MSVTSPHSVTGDEKELNSPAHQIKIHEHLLVCRTGPRRAVYTEAQAFSLHDTVSNQVDSAVVAQNTAPIQPDTAAARSADPPGAPTRDMQTDFWTHWGDYFSSWIYDDRHDPVLIALCM